MPAHVAAPPVPGHGRTPAELQAGRRRAVVLRLSPIATGAVRARAAEIAAVPVPAAREATAAVHANRRRQVLGSGRGLSAVAAAPVRARATQTTAVSMGPESKAAAEVDAQRSLRYTGRFSAHMNPRICRGLCPSSRYTAGRAGHVYVETIASEISRRAGKDTAPAAGLYCASFD